MRYIDADKILYTDLSEGRGVCWVTFMDWIKKMPTADVRENVKAYWNNINDKYYSCSYCGGCADIAYHYCPWCGADMRGAE